MDRLPPRRVFEVTVNVALSDDASHEGGRLLGVFGGAVQPLLRAEGDATVHSCRLLHAVSAMTGGTRYALILFFDRRARAGRRTRWSTPAAAVSKVEGRDAFSVRVSGGGVGPLFSRTTSA